MNAIVVKTGSYLLVITLGYLFKKIGLFCTEDSKVFAKLSLNICLPAAIIASFKGFEFAWSQLNIALFGFLINIVMAVFALVTSHVKKGTTKAMYLLNMSSFNIGSFALPFLVDVFPASTLIYIIMFDVGNSLYCLGVNYALAEYSVKQSTDFNVSDFTRKLVSTPPFMTYLLMLGLLIIGVRLPSITYDIANIAGQANVFIVMFMFGLLFNPILTKQATKDAFFILGGRYFLMLIVIGFMWLTMPIKYQGKQALSIALLVPMTSVATTYCLKLNCDEEVASFVSSISIPLSVMLIIIASVFLNI